MAYWVALAWPHFAYLHDDLILFAVARQSGLSRHLLAYNLFEHFSPIDHAFYWLELTISPLNPTAGTIIVGILIIGMLAALNWLLLELGAGWLRRALAIFFLGTSIVTITVTTWWGQGVYIPIATSMILLVVAAHVRAVRTRRWRWHVAAWAFAILGVLISERTLFTPLFVVLLDVALVWRDATWSAAIRHLWRLRWPFAGLFAISMAGALFIRARYYLPYPFPRHVSDVGRLIVTAYSQWFLPALAGFYSNIGVPALVGSVLLVASLILCIALVAADRGNLTPLAFFASVFVIDYGFLGIGRLGIYSVEQEASDIQYVAWVLPLLLVTLCLLRAPGSGLRRPLLRRAALVVGAVGTAGILLNGFQFTNQHSAFHIRAAAHEFWVNLLADTDQWAAPSTSVLPTRVPVDFAADFADPYGRMEVLLPVVRPGVEVGRMDAGSAPALIDAQGRVRPAEFQVDAVLTGDRIAVAGVAVAGSLSSIGGQACVRPDTSSAYLQVALPGEIRGSPLMVELSYSSPVDAGVRLTGFSAASPRINPLLSSIHAGSHTGVFALEAEIASGLQISNLQPGHDFCLSSLRVVLPVARDDAGACRTIDRYGYLGAVRNCPGSN